MRQARIDLTTGDLLETRTLIDRTKSESKWVPLLEEDPPPVDSSTEKLERTTITAPDKQSVTLGFQVVPLTAEELAERQATADAASATIDERNQIRAALTQLDGLRMPLAQIQQLLARIIRELYGEEAE